MKNRLVLFIIFVLVLTSIHIYADAIEAIVLLPDGNPAPYATVTVGEDALQADGNGKVTLDVGADVKTVTVKWLDLTAELPVSENLKFRNKVLYGPPYSKDDFLITGPDIWEIKDTEIVTTADSESSIFYEDAFENTILRAKYTLDDAAQWYYIRFFIRLYDAGFNGYSLNFPGIGDAYYARYDGNWDQHVGMTFFRFRSKVKTEYEFVMFAKDENITVYHRETANKYTKVLDINDSSPDAYYDGGFAIMNSFLSCKITELGLFAY